MEIFRIFIYFLFVCVQYIQIRRRAQLHSYCFFHYYGHFIDLMYYLVHWGGISIFINNQILFVYWFWWNNALYPSDDVRNVCIFFYKNVVLIKISLRVYSMCNSVNNYLLMTLYAVTSSLRCYYKIITSFYKCAQNNAE